MKKSLISIVGLVFALSVGIVYASGPGAWGTFDDLSWDSDKWYTEAAYSMLSKGVIEGADGNFNASDNVNRAQMVVILDRFYDAVIYPKDTKWDEYENDYYSVSYPSDHWIGVAGIATYTGAEDDCGSNLSGIGDFSMGISCNDSSETSVQELVDEMWDHMDRSVSSDTFTLNGENATLVTFTTPTGHYSENVYVESGDKIFVLWGSSMPYDRAFAQFYRSFRVL